MHSNSSQLHDNFQRIKFGEFLAEHEIDDLSDYYVETFNLDELIKNDYNIVIGRKGTGGWKNPSGLSKAVIFVHYGAYHVSVSGPANVQDDAGER